MSASDPAEPAAATDGGGGEVVGDLVSLADGQVLLPKFMLRQADGLWVDISLLHSRDLFPRFVERVFGSNARFAGLDYELFRRLLFDYSLVDVATLLDKFEKAGQKPVLRLATDIVSFPLPRQALYRGTKVLGDGEGVEYLFEQVSLDVETQVPLYDETTPADSNGNRPISGYETRIVPQRTQLDFDEFVTALWNKEVRYGIDATAVRAAIARDKSERLTVASSMPPTPGKDASIAEQSELLHRDDSPRILADGRMDLRSFRNRFPQVSEGARLFKKVPRVAGVSGWNVLGRELAPEAVKDFDVMTLSGPGTRIERDDAGNEYVVAAMDGFLNIDTKSNQLSVSDKIINREGVSIRSTGDLALSGDDYEEHGEVQEKRVVEGHNMTFLADVFGSIVSSDGRVLFRQKISGGSAKSPAGSIVVEGSASRATLEACRGSIEVAQAESSVLIGQVVRVARAVNCQIVADEVAIEVAEGCAIAGRNVTVGEAKARRDQGTVVTLLLPDKARYEADIAAAAKERQEAEALVQSASEALAQLTTQPDLKAYVTLQPKVKAGTLAMTAEQDANWRRLLTRVAPLLKDLAKCQAEVQTLQETIADAGGRAASLRQELDTALAAVHCSIGAAGEETLVRSRIVTAHAPPLASLPAKELQLRLREAGGVDERLFAGTGSFAWPSGD